MAASATSHDVTEHANVPATRIRRPTPIVSAPFSSGALSRRRFLAGTSTLATAALTTAPAAAAAEKKATSPSASPALIDTNAYLGRWPFRRTALDTGEALRDKLRQHQVSEAWVGHLDALLACFPGGSITGVPKKRAREIIAELEPCPRGLYTGAIGCLGFNGESRFNIAIRTLVAEADELHFHVGAGIVADSVPLREWEETLHKAAGIFRTCGAHGS